MQYCSKCGIHIRGNKKCCPLCQGPLTGEPEDPAFPVLPKHTYSSLSVMKVAVFIFAICEIALAALWYLARSTRAWTPVAGFAVFLLLADLAVALYYRYNIIKIVTFECYFIMLLILAVDRLTGFHGWSLAFVLPFLFLALIIATTVIARAVHLHLVDYVIYIALDVILACLQLIPLSLHDNPFPIFAVITLGVILVYAVAIVIFRTRDLKSASGKWFHV